MISAAFTYLIASLVLGIPIALTAAAVVRWWRPLSAASRYAVWYVALIGVVVAPLIVACAAPRTSFVVERRIVLRDVVAVSRHAHPPALTRHDLRVSPNRAFFAVPKLAGTALVGAWLALALVGFVRFAAAVRALGRLKRDALPLSPDARAALTSWRGVRPARRARLCVSDAVDVPLAVGIFDAMVLLPRRVLDTFAPADVDRFVLHELAHLDRRDDWGAAVQRLVQIVLFFNPAVYAIARALDVEREIACDDRVVATTSDARSYASGLTRMAETAAWPQRRVAAPAVFASRTQLSVRVEELLARRSRSVALARAPVIAVSLAALVTAAAGVLTVPVVSVGEPRVASTVRSAHMILIEHGTMRSFDVPLTNTP